MNTGQMDPDDARNITLDYYHGPETVNRLLDALT